ncbi:F-type H+-transporting ATPase subunit epsilon [Arcanobacterium wilhelmae]|uniref:F-type H+-transporting ATPase subunit epsilon n=1 Tax=Arcanobacterium wilhelmae TaxID=1803177 RepID=A0ABT9N9X9_9ACTO|nr:F0F1 ATP synthase subunit epsilon [Arcanobacterium wilhelmae]MDP9800501.1 F-type H+-transporting ATPase subunit epsilon [Arcanobacterium wilhelmae]WFN89920.1 F0F1 ATP synthase subunit epsilon [Arcanobacterium wilhelmae]
MQLQVVARTGELYAGEVSSVTLPSYEGDMTILAGHTPVLAVLVPGTVRYKDAQGTGEIETARGFVTVDHDKVLVVVDGRRGETVDPTEL